MSINSCCSCFVFSFGKTVSKVNTFKHLFRPAVLTEGYRSIPKAAKGHRRPMSFIFACNSTKC